MSNLSQEPNDSLIDLLIKQATEGLSADEQAVLDSTDPSIISARRESFELMLGALSAALMERLEAPPESLKADIEQQASTHFDGHPSQRRPGPEQHVAGQPVGGQNSISFSNARWAWLSAATCLVLAVIGWMRPSRVEVTTPPVSVQLTVPAPKIPEPELPPVSRTVAQERDALLARAESLTVSLAPSKDPAALGVSADVVWDPATNSGFLHIVGLKPNDPAIKQYQAWVFDGLRDKRYPLDCALFNVPADASEVIIPIQTAIPVRLAKAFAITVEQAGGVVVPDKVHVVALGTAG